MNKIEWRPIRTAPKDGTRILLATWKKVADGYWDVHTNGSSHWVWPYIFTEPTHWTDLPNYPD